MTPSKPLTASEIAALPDRELDAAVAKEVMGWKHDALMGRHTTFCWWTPDGGVAALQTHQFSTNPRAMMEVVGRMQGLGYRDVQFSWEGDKYNAFFANYPGNASNQKSGSALHEKLPRAVSEAALLAVLSGEGE